MAPPAAGHIRPGRYLGIFALIVIVMYALVFATGDHKPSPRLGIDLKGGTTVTLTARTLDGKPPDAQQLAQAQQIINSRVNGLGVSGAQVVTQGNNIVITVPGSEGEEAKTLGETARLYLRPVTQSAAVVPPTAASQSPSSGSSTSGTPTTTAPKTTAPTTTPASPTSKAQGLGAPGAAGGLVLDANSKTTTKATAAAATTTPAATPTTTATPAAGVNQNDCWGVTPAQKAAEGPLNAQQQSALLNECRTLRQTTDTTAQQAALSKLNCGTAPGGGTYYDPLVGNDDPTKPLVACDQKGQYKYVLSPSIIDGTQVTNPSSGANPEGAGYVVNLGFSTSGNPSAATTWATYTAANVGKTVAWTLDSEVVSAATIQSAISGNTQISGNFTQAEAQDLANILKYGSLPLAFDVSNAETISPTLGLSSLEAGLIAGAIGLLLVVIYCLMYYRALGLLTVLSLALSGVTVYSVLVLLGRWIGYSLDLAGVAGFIIAIGITADSFVIFFERLKDEVREGRTFRSAVPRAWVRARRTILVSDAVSFLAAVVLYVVAVSDVQGFAFTLGMSTLLDLLIVFLVTHPLVALASRSKTLSKPSMSGLGAVQRAGAAMRAAHAAPAVAGGKEA
ncbi:MAG TPA: protein translocase subunit SecD [Pseudonocardiaceae bacterium]